MMQGSFFVFKTDGKPIAFPSLLFCPRSTQKTLVVFILEIVLLEMFIFTFSGYKYKT